MPIGPGVRVATGACNEAIRKLKEAIENLAEPSAAAIAAAHHHEPYRKAEDGIAKDFMAIGGSICNPNNRGFNRQS